jgi:hypothetical protein
VGRAAAALRRATPLVAARSIDRLLQLCDSDRATRRCGDELSRVACIGDSDTTIASAQTPARASPADSQI